MAKRSSGKGFRPGQKVSYQFLSAGGRRYVDVNKYWDILPRKEQIGIEMAARYKGRDLRLFNKEEFDAFMTFGEKSRKEQIDIITGRTGIEALDVLSENYAKGLNWMNTPELATRFLGMYNAIKEEGDATKLEMFMEELPDLYLYYKDRESDPSKAHQDRRKAFDQTTAQDQVDEFKRVLALYEENWDKTHNK